ncbi:coagulation factor X [Carettochelys insculpta]|uniref:coagulation factor X n=1 Tax=Carettochelys insculpta TaxID=44489 RepID=UPI003EB8AB8D
MHVIAGLMLFILLSTSLAALLQAEGNVFLQEENANKFLGRAKRANSLFEELKQGNIERECYEERCSKEEAREAFEDTAKTEEFWNKYVDGDQCKPNPCQYGGQCKDGIGSYTCTCLEGYQGKNCESVIIKYCKVNNGDCDHFCRPARNGVVCLCATGYVLGEDGKSCMPTEPFPCGKVYVKRNKRSVISLGISGSEQDGKPNELYVNNGTSHKNVTNVTDSLNVHLQNEAEAPNTTENAHIPKGSPKHQVRIVGGEDCWPGECPWQALLLNEDMEGFCGGTILNQFYILTAAHCINQSKIIRVVLGEVDREKEENSEAIYSVEKVFVHGKFVLATYDYDIALIKLKEPIKFSRYIIPACLPDVDFANDILMNQKSGRVSGFGRLFENGRLSTKLKVLEVPYIDRNSCKLSSSFRITENMFCAGYGNVSKDACQGDSGGPHVTKYKDTYFVTGIVSWGEGCARKGKYGVYTKVSKLTGWLMKRLGETF